MTIWLSTYTENGLVCILSNRSAVDRLLAAGNSGYPRVGLHRLHARKLGPPRATRSARGGATRRPSAGASRHAQELARSKSVCVRHTVR